MWVIEVINTLDSNALDTATASTPATSTTCGRSSPRRSSTSSWHAPDRQHDPVRVHGRDHRAAGREPARARDADRDRRRRARHVAGGAPAAPSRSVPAASCSAMPPTCSRAGSSTAACSRSRSGSWSWVVWGGALLVERRAPPRHLVAGARVRGDRRRGRRVAAGDGHAVSRTPGKPGPNRTTLARALAS